MEGYKCWKQYLFRDACILRRIMKHKRLYLFRFLSIFWKRFQINKKVYKNLQERFLKKTAGLTLNPLF